MVRKYGVLGHAIMVGVVVCFDACRVDCPGQYAVGLLLDEMVGNDVPSIQSFVVNSMPSRYHYYSFQPLRTRGIVAPAGVWSRWVVWAGCLWGIN